MAKNTSVIDITIKAFLPTGKTIDDQVKALTAVKEAHESGDYTELLKMATIENVKAKQVTRRIDDDESVE